MRAHIIHLAPMYAVAIAAGLLTVLAIIGLFTDLLGLHQIVVIASTLVFAITLSLILVRPWHR